MEIKHEDNGIKGEFYIEAENAKVAEMTYVYKDKSIIDINHTEVDDSLQGQGVGSKLIAAAVAFMRENNLKVVPSCSYAKVVFERKQEVYRDVLVS